MRQGTIGAAGEHDGCPRAHHNAAGLRVGQVFQLYCTFFSSVRLSGHLHLLSLTHQLRVLGRV